MVVPGSFLNLHLTLNHKMSQQKHSQKVGPQVLLSPLSKQQVEQHVHLITSQSADKSKPNISQILDGITCSVKLFPSNLRICICGNRPYSLGIFPDSWLLSTVNSTKFEQWPSSEANVPVKLF
mmetsp:Transcript_3562/g.5212  ORF Transcript_3562/g.5212 Transcript_3562/m.5212 type:complete len:123 (-) Transcript_3562:2252-2620(-)